MIEYTTILASELLFNFFVLAAFWTAGALTRKWLPRSLATGILLAASSYIRPIALLLAPLMFLREAMIERKAIRAIAACTLSVIVMLALLLPWSLRNTHVFGKFVLVSTNAGANFWMGNNPKTDGGYMDLPETGIANEADRYHYLHKLASEYIWEKPVAFLTRTIKKAILLHDRESIGVAWNEQGLQQRFGHRILMPLKLVSTPYWWLMLASALYGTFLLFRHRPWLDVLTLPPLTAWAYFIAVHSVVVNGDRYHMPSIPFIAMLAAYGLVCVIKSPSFFREN